MKELLNIFWYSWLNKFLYTSKKIVKSFKDWKVIFIIELELDVKQITHIENNILDFSNILNIVLSTFNKTFCKEFKNITFNNVKLWEEIKKNCIILYTSKINDNTWFLKTNKIIELNIVKKQKNNFNKTNDILVDGIIGLIHKENVSVRNLIKLWIVQIRARELFNFFKDKEVFEIKDYNKNSKIYNFEKLKDISINDIKSIIYR